jgi:putative membrane protein
VTKQETAAWIAAGVVAVAELAPAFLPQSGWWMMLSSGGLIAFLLTHGSLIYGWRGAVGFLACVYPVAFAFEALSVATGFPFGYFTHNGPDAQLLGVPPAVPILYATAGYLAWSIARLLTIGDRPGPLTGAQRFVVPPVAALALAGYDAVFDPSGATLNGGWSFQAPSGLFGVPLTNSLGWILTGWVAFQIYAFFAPPARSTGRFRVLPPLLWLGLFLPSVVAFVFHPVPVTDAVTVAGRTFLAADIQETAVIVGMFSMGTPALAALAQLLSRRVESGGQRNLPADISE